MATIKYYKFTKKEAFDFIQKVNDGEKIIPSLENTTDSYCQPIVFMGDYYIIADEVTKKYIDAEIVDFKVEV